MFSKQKTKVVLSLFLSSLLLISCGKGGKNGTTTTSKNIQELVKQYDEKISLYLTQK